MTSSRGQQGRLYSDSLITRKELSVRDGGSSNTRLDLDQAHSYDVGVLLATLTYYFDSKQIVVDGNKTRRMKEILR